jgi:flagellar motor switch protein FliN/FliY
VKVAFRLKIGDLIDSTLMQLLTVPFAKEMVATLLGGSQPRPNEPGAAANAQTAAPSAPAPQASPSVQHVAEPAPDSNKPQRADSVHEPSARQAAPNHYGGVPNRGVNVQPVQFESLNSQPMIADETNLSLLLDIPLKVTVELGRTKKLIKEILEFSQGTIIELDKLAGEPVDIMVNNKLIAKGEVVVIDENFGVRVTDIISPMDRIQKLQ